jgi:hypothetical protein
VHGTLHAIGNSTCDESSVLGEFFGRNRTVVSQKVGHLAAACSCGRVRVGGRNQSMGAGNLGLLLYPETSHITDCTGKPQVVGHHEGQARRSVVKDKAANPEFIVDVSSRGR